MTETRTITLPGTARARELDTGSLLFIGNATVLLRYGGFTIVTDPNFLHQGEKVALGYGLHARRVRDPAIELSELPPLDLVVLSHMHEDHFDRGVARDLSRTVPIVSTQHATASLASMGFEAPQALDTWETIEFVRGEVALRITSMPGKHGPGLFSAALPPVMGSLLEFGPRDGVPRFSVYISGDTLLHPELVEVARRYRGMDLALLHLGGTKALGLLLTMDARQGVKLLRKIEPQVAIPIHYNDYTVFTSPLEDFRREVDAAGLSDRVVYLAHGEMYEFTAREV